MRERKAPAFKATMSPEDVVALVETMLAGNGGQQAAFTVNTAVPGADDKDPEIDQIEHEIDAFAIRMIALRQPVAKDGQRHRRQAGGASLFVHPPLGARTHP